MGDIIYEVADHVETNAKEGTRSRPRTEGMHESSRNFQTMAASIN